MGLEEAIAAEGSADPVYSHKPSLIGAAWDLRLRPDALEWRTSRHAGRIQYGSIARVRLSYRPVALQSRRFVAEIWQLGKPRLAIPSTSWRSVTEQERQDQAYGAFIRELHRRISRFGAQVSYEAGLPFFVYWPGLVLFAATGLALVALIVRGLQAGAFAGAALVGIIFVPLLWQSGTFFWRNQPGRYRPDALPERLVPAA